jgi:FtsH-binding integral membrane protein
MRSIRRWTSCQVVVVALVALVLVYTAFAAHGDRRWVFLVETGILLAGMATEPFVGLLVALVGAVGLVAAERTAGT